MALARIITRSHQCSRELAWDLLARGYTVEIVSPDAIPDNLADLELRVDADTADVLTASVQTHDGARSASLEFVHHLRSPMMDFMRKPPGVNEPVYVPVEPARSPVEQPVNGSNIFEIRRSESEEVPASIPPEHLEALSLLSDRLTVFEESPVLPPGPEEEAPLEVEQTATPALTNAHEIQEQKPANPSAASITEPSRNNSGFSGWMWRAALTFAAVLVVALALGFALGRGGAGPVQTAKELSLGDQTKAPDSSSLSTSAAANANTIVQSTPQHPSPQPVPTKPAVAIVKAPPVQPVVTPPKGQAAVPHTDPLISRAHGDDVIAHNTITYFGKSGAKALPVGKSQARKSKAAKSSPAKPKQHHARVPRQSGGAIAADTVTYLNGKAASKATAK